MEQYIEQLKPVFASVAEKIGQGAEFGWEVVIRQQFVEAIIIIVGFLVGIILIFLRYWIGRSDPWEDITVRSGVAFCLIITAVFLIIATLLELIVGGGIGKLINPEYYALEFFINLVK